MKCKYAFPLLYCININLKQTYFWEPCISSYQHHAHKENKDYMIYNNLGA